ncbi:hypothetical protein DENSPDRAFT_163412 [Dentipellis sp. KUC8613]|nr:hypothetical protein DENSPDRAFT_163412 [Dentipellis sp. KUC8613]
MSAVVSFTNYPTTVDHGHAVSIAYPRDKLPFLGYMIAKTRHIQYSIDRVLPRIGPRRRSLGSRTCVPVGHATFGQDSQWPCPQCVWTVQHPCRIHAKAVRMVMARLLRNPPGPPADPTRPGPSTRHGSFTGAQDSALRTPRGSSPRTRVTVIITPSADIRSRQAIQ